MFTRNKTFVTFFSKICGQNYQAQKHFQFKNYLAKNIWIKKFKSEKILRPK